MIAPLDGVGRLVLAAALSGLIGLEREIRQKDAGLRTHLLVGLGGALVMMVSQYGFSDVVVKDTVILDPSRVAAQVVSGIGFLGAGVIFVSRRGVHGLTTAAGVWLAAGIGLAVGAGLILWATAATVTGLGADLVLRLLEVRLRRSRFPNAVAIWVRCRDEPGTLAGLAAALAAENWNIDRIGLEREGLPAGVVENRMLLSGGRAGSLPGILLGVAGVLSVGLADGEHLNVE